MDRYELRSARYLAAEIRAKVILPGDTVIDATVGNGHDTCDLARLVGERGHVYGFDIQEQAISSAQRKLQEQGLSDRCTLIHDSHAHISQYVHEPVSAVVFNLGWLPGGDKSITTVWDSTFEALKQALTLLLPGGVCTVCAYPGHEAGNHEREQLSLFLAELSNREYIVLHQRFINASQGSPECYAVQKQFQ